MEPTTQCPKEAWNSEGTDSVRYPKLTAVPGPVASASSYLVVPATSHSQEPFIPAQHHAGDRSPGTSITMARSPIQPVFPFETAGLSPTDSTIDLPFAEDGEDDMDMFLNLEDAEEPSSLGLF